MCSSIYIGFRPPRGQLLEQFRRIRGHLQEHDGLVEMVQVVRGEQRLLVDIRSPDLRAKDFQGIRVAVHTSMNYLDIIQVTPCRRKLWQIGVNRALNNLWH